MTLREELSYLPVVRAGTWRQGAGAALGYVWIVRHNWDYLADHQPGPMLGSEGDTYFVIWGPTPELGDRSSRSRTCFTFDRARSLAEQMLGDVHWDDVC
jgi:hypothetical protein